MTAQPAVDRTVFHFCEYFLIKEKWDDNQLYKWQS